MGRSRNSRRCQAMRYKMGTVTEGISPREHQVHTALPNPHLLTEQTSRSAAPTWGAQEQDPWQQSSSLPFTIYALPAPSSTTPAKERCQAQAGMPPRERPRGWASGHINVLSSWNQVPLGTTRNIRKNYEADTPTTALEKRSGTEKTFQGEWFSTSGNIKTTYRASQKCRQLGTSPDTQNQTLWGGAGEFAFSESSESMGEKCWLSLGPRVGAKQTQNQVLDSGQYFQRPAGDTLLLKGLRHGMLGKEPSGKKAGSWEVKSECLYFRTPRPLLGQGALYPIRQSTFSKCVWSPKLAFEKHP